MLNKKNILLLCTLYSVLCTLLISGCATVPRAASLASVTIKGARYVPVESLSKSLNLSVDWDPVAQKVVLAKGDQQARFMAGSSVALLNNKVQTMEQPARVYQGSLAIPATYSSQTLDSFFQQRYVQPKPLKLTDLPVKTVIIDAGHGGKDPGAVGRSGLKEKEVTLDVAQRLKRKLNARGIKVILTRDSDEFVSLDQRSRIANAHAEEADFFISVHANAARSRWVSGVEVFYLSESIDDNQRSLTAAKSYDLHLAEAYSGKDTPAILWDLIYSDNRKSSIEMAEHVCQALSKDLCQKNRGTKPAQFYVLKGSNIPAILLEVGFISNPQEEKKLRSSAYRDEIAQGVIEGLMQYNYSVHQRKTARY